jgi:hypothetical protein
VSAPAPEATGNDSRSPARSSGAPRAQVFVLLLRGFLALAGAAGVVLLVLATRATIIEIRIGAGGGNATGIDTTLTGADRHGPALIVVAVFAAMMLAGALRGATPATFGVAAAGVLALGIAIIGDAAHIHDAGAVGQVYTEARAGAGTGFYLETLGGALLLMSGGGLLVLGVGRDAPIAEPARRRAASTPPEAAPQPEDHRPPRPRESRVEDWFAD